MKQISVYFKEPVPYTYTTDQWNAQQKKWERVEVTEMIKSKVFYNLTAAKKFAKEHFEQYNGSSITKVWANGDWENCGELKFKGSNKHFIANTRQTKAGY